MPCLMIKLLDELRGRDGRRRPEGGTDALSTCVRRWMSWKRFAVKARCEDMCDATAPVIVIEGRRNISL